MAARLGGVRALRNLAKDIEALPAVSRQAARLSLNSVLEREALPTIRRDMQAEVKFPAGYINKDRLALTKRATDADLTATITARHRPTSLARFAQGQSFTSGQRRGYVSVRVHGATKKIRRAFFVRLRRGRDTSDGYNLGLAVRLRPGERLQGRRLGGSGVQLAPDLYLLYGPSVSQLFESMGQPSVVKTLPSIDREYHRQFVRLSRGR